MNDKIKELAQEATEWCRENAQGTPVAWEWENRFAELIVREVPDDAVEQLAQALAADQSGRARHDRRQPCHGRLSAARSADR